MSRRRFPLITLVSIALGAGVWLGGLLHGGLLALLLSLAALLIFGQSVEDALGRARYVLLMAAGALVALVAQMATGQPHGAATLACAGVAAVVVGAYIALHRRARVYAVLFAPLFSSVLAIPALLVLAAWIGAQVAIGLGVDEPLASIGAAWFAHLAAIVAGLLAARPLARAGRDRGGRAGSAAAGPAV